MLTGVGTQLGFTHQAQLAAMGLPTLILVLLQNFENLAATNASAPAACPWHQFWQHAADKASWQAGLKSLRQHAADNKLHTTAWAAVVVPLLTMLCQRQGRRLLFQVSAWAW